MNIFLLGMEIFFCVGMEYFLVGHGIFLCCAWNFVVGHGIFFCVGHGNLNLWNDLWGSANFFRGIILFVRILG